MVNTLSFRNKDAKSTFTVEWESDEELSGPAAGYLKEARGTSLNRLPDGLIEIGPHGMTLLALSGLRTEKMVTKITSEKDT